MDGARFVYSVFRNPACVCVSCIFVWRSLKSQINKFKRYTQCPWEVSWCNRLKATDEDQLGE